MTSGKSYAVTLTTVLVVSICAGACGGDDSNSSETVPVRPGDRLEWSQAANSAASLQAHRFNLYVDGALAEFADTSCNEIPAGNGYNCSGRLPPMSAGRHSLALSSVLNGVESVRSSALVVEMRSASVTAVVGASSASPPTSTASTPAATTCTPSGGACYNVSSVADDVGRPSDLTRASESLLLFVEDYTRVRAIESGSLLPDAAFSSDSSSRIVGMTADADFNRTRHVFIATSEPTGTGTASLTITRYREVNGVLGEGAAIVSGLFTTPMAMVPLAVDSNGLLYVAMPADPATMRGDSTLGGTILRFDRDGLTPRSNPRSVPAIAHGYTQPTTLAVDEANQRFWLGGRSSTGPSLARLALDQMGATWPLHPVMIDVAALSVTRSSEVVAGPAIALATAGAPSSALVTADALLVVGALPPDGRSASLDVLPVGDMPVSVARDSGDAWYVAVLTDRRLGRILMLQRKAGY